MEIDAISDNATSDPQDDMGSTSLHTSPDKFISASESDESAPTASNNCQQSNSLLESQLRGKNDEINFLKSTNQGLLADMKELEEYVHHIHAAHEELMKAHKTLQGSYSKLHLHSEKETDGLQAKLTEMQQKVEELVASNAKFLNSKARKSYHELGSTQKAVVHRQVRETIGPEIDQLMETRQLTAAQVVLEYVNGQKAAIKINMKPLRTFDELTDVERETVAVMSDSNSLHRTSNAAYAAKRRIIKDLPPLSHLKQYHQLIMSQLPKIIVAPIRSGGFLPIRAELKLQLEHLDCMGNLDQTETVHVKVGVDGTRLTHNNSVCIYTVESISTATDIGLVGAVKGGDGRDDMAQCGAPFFQQLEEIDKNPVIQTDIGDIPIELRGGGDLCNLYTQLVLSAATAKYCCPLCICPKGMFWATAINPALLHDCNSHGLGQTRGNIMNEAIRSKPAFSVKNMPQTPLPRDPNTLIIKWMLLCTLHMDMRICG